MPLAPNQVSLPQKTPTTQQAESSAPVARSDPPQRKVDAGWTSWNALLNRDPSKKYVWASLGDQETGAAYYAALGYEEERYEEGGVRPHALRRIKPGELIEMRGNVLMSCPVEKARDIELYGPDGGTGQSRVDAIEKQLKLKNGLLDTTRGFRSQRIQNQYMAVEDTRPFES